MSIANKMLVDSAYGHTAGAPIECVSRPVQLHKQLVHDPLTALDTYRVGFKIGGGIDQDPHQSPFNYPDTGIYITHVEPDSCAEKAGLKQHDKILQVNGYDLTVVPHDKAVKYIKKDQILQLLIARDRID